MFKSIGIAAFGTAFGVSMLGVVAICGGLVAVGAVGGYLIAGKVGVAAGLAAAAA